MISITVSNFGNVSTGEPAYAWKMKNGNGMEVTLISWAAAIQSILVPDKNGALRDVVLGYDTIGEYEAGTCWFGAFVGRYANRIEGSAFELNGKKWTLPANDGRNHLHGEPGKRPYTAEVVGDSVVFHGVSPDGEEGFPGTVTFTVAYQLTEDNALKITYRAETDADTVVNFTNHSYFNLNGQTGETIYDHVLTLNCDEFTEGNEETIPTGRILPVAGTPMDFTAGRALGESIDSDYPQLVMSGGYDHNFVIRGTAGTLREAAKLVSNESGIVMRCLTTQPGVQLYSGNYILPPSSTGKKGMVYPRRGGMCLETQHYPCSPNHPEFPSTVLHCGEKYEEVTIYQFETL